jgi:hypothetical protein
MTIPLWSSASLVPVTDALLAHLGGRDPAPSRDEQPEYKICNARAFDAGFIAETTSLTLPDLRALLRSNVPCILHSNGGVILAVIRGARTGVQLLAPDGSVCEAKVTDVEHAMTRTARQRAASLVARVALSFARHVATLFGLSLVQSVLGTGAWAVIGALALRGHADSGSLLGWALLSLTAVLIQVFTTRYVGDFTLRASTRMRMRLLEGALSLEGDELSAHGMGGMMVISTQADQFLNAVVALLLSCLATLTNAIATVAILFAAPLPVPGLSRRGFGGSTSASRASACASRPRRSSECSVTGRVSCSRRPRPGTREKTRRSPDMGSRPAPSTDGR